MKKISQKEVKEQQRSKEECPKDTKDIDVANVAASGATSNNGSACRYKTQGTIASIDLMCKAFTIDPVFPYAFEQKKGDVTEKYILFVLVEDKDNVIKGAKILMRKPDFKISMDKDKDVDLGSLIALKNGREKIELEVELKDDFDTGKDKLQVESLKTIK